MRALSLGLVGLSFALALAPPPACAADAWPDHPVTVVVPFPAGSAVDSLARATAQALSEGFNKPFVVDNRAGAGGNIGGAAVAKARADGYTVLFGTPSPIALNKLLYKGLSYDSDKDFAPVVLVAKSPLIVAAKLDFPPRTFAEMIAYAKQNPLKVNVGNPGNGTLGHITAALIQQATDTQMSNIPYRGTMPLLGDLLGGQVDVAMDFMPTYLPQVASNKIRALAVTTRARVKQLPDVPTVQESGFTGFEASAWYAVVAPTGTPPEIVGKLNAAINAYIKSDKGKTMLEQNSLDGVGGSPDDLKAFVAAELTKWRPVIEAANIVME
jgi:tripartite-type tricarboxylate transporter receptor subunit TctC